MSILNEDVGTNIKAIVAIAIRDVLFCKRSETSRYLWVISP